MSDTQFDDETSGQRTPISPTDEEGNPGFQ